MSCYCPCLGPTDGEPRASEVVGWSAIRRTAVEGVAAAAKAEVGVPCGWRAGGAGMLAVDAAAVEEVEVAVPCGPWVEGRRAGDARSPAVEGTTAATGVDGGLGFRVAGWRLGVSLGLGHASGARPLYMCFVEPI